MAGPTWRLWTGMIIAGLLAPFARAGAEQLLAYGDDQPGEGDFGYVLKGNIQINREGGGLMTIKKLSTVKGTTCKCHSSC